MDMLVKCSKCKKEISDKLNVCPYCGSNLYDGEKYNVKNIITCAIGIILAIVLVVVVYDACTVSPDEALKRANDAFDKSKASLERTEDELRRAKNKLNDMYDLYGY